MSDQKMSNNGEVNMQQIGGRKTSNQKEKGKEHNDNKDDRKIDTHKNNNQKTRKQVFLDYYTNEDYDEVLDKLPDIIKEAERKASEVLEPTIYEKREVMKVIQDFVRDKKRKVYGGIALNETLKYVNPDDAIYDENAFADMDFYSPTPVVDLIELTNILYKKGYKYVTGKEAQHEETYKVFVNFTDYCDITYVPKRVYQGIKTITIDGIHYCHPHFMLIDYFRMINDPMNAAGQRWEKAFKRMYKLLKDYPLEYFENDIVFEKTSDEIQSYLSKIKNNFLIKNEVQEYCLVCGWDAYNFYISYAADTINNMSRLTANPANKLLKKLVKTPYIEVVSVKYTDAVQAFYSFIKSIVIDPAHITIDEYFPLFQFTNNMAVINYQGIPLAKIYEADGFCIPTVKTKKYLYVSFQYLLMFMLINKFRCFLDKKKEMYFNYGYAISNLVLARNTYLDNKHLGVINDSIYSDFRISCVGSTVSYLRMSLLRALENKNKGKRPRFDYKPEEFFKLSKEAQERFDPSRHLFRNTAGNKVLNPKNLRFNIDEKRNLVLTHDVSEEYTESAIEEASPMKNDFDEKDK